VTEADASLIETTLTIVAERRGDPTADVYAQLFRAYPELEALFVMDRDGGVRASMMQQALECILDHAEGGRMARAVIGAARFHHDGYGVPAARFDAFFVAIRDTFRVIMSADWTPDMDRAWDAMLADFASAR
jgi:hemoglobin-like flavoprotein